MTGTSLALTEHDTDKANLLLRLYTTITQFEILTTYLLKAFPEVTTIYVKYQLDMLF